MEESTQPAAEIIVRRNGPLRVRGRVRVVDGDGNEFEKPNEIFALCRCGHSETKPFCDGHHREIAFQDESHGVSAATDGLGENPIGEEVTILVRPNGPYRIYGLSTLVDMDGNAFEIPEGDWYTLCRCGHSATKPFCDSTHKTLDFRPETRVIPNG